MNDAESSVETRIEVSKSQNVRLADMLLYGPFMLWASTQKKLPKWSRVALAALGFGTIFYNARNYFFSSSSYAKGPQVDSLGKIFIQNWLELLCSKDKRIVELYSPDAVLLPTFSEIKKGRSEIAGYFEEFMQKDGLCGTVDTQHTTLIGNGLSTSGIYTFGFTEGGIPKSQRARFSFTFKPVNGSWLIDSHHSSVIP